MTARASRRAPLAPSDLIVIGAGAAGTAAALSAARAGLAVTVIDGGSGASTLWTGALDGSPSDEPIRAALEVLGGYALPDHGARVVTVAGATRSAVGHDASLLDVASLATGVVGVVRCRRPGWDADALAAAWGHGFIAIDARLARYVGEDMVPDSDFAARHDDDARLDWLAERLREAMTSADKKFAALALPPSLGVDLCRAYELSRRVGVRCGEAVGLPGGPAGLRFERARDRALAEATSLRRLRARARGVIAAPAGWRVETETGETLEAARVVLAAGGLIGGGIEYAPSEATLATALPPRSQAAFRMGFLAPAPIAAHGRELEPAASLFGPSPERLAPSFGADSTFERAGVMTSALGEVRGAPGLFAAGDIVADTPHTWLTAFAAGWRIGRRLAAAARAAGPPLTGEPPFLTPPTRP